MKSGLEKSTIAKTEEILKANKLISEQVLQKQVTD